MKSCKIITLFLLMVAFQQRIQVKDNLAPDSIFYTVEEASLDDGHVKNGTKTEL